MTEKWPRGSEWRKWDLQVHSPGTKQSDNFKVDEGDVWDEYCRCLHESDVAAFGITDYFSLDGYLETVKQYRSRYPDCKKVFFPNVELRTSYVVNKAREEVNLHVIFNPFRDDCAAEAEKFLRCLNTNRTEAGERDVKASELVHTSEYEEASTTQECVRDALAETFGRRADLIDYVLIFIAANNDGIRAERGVKRKARISDELDKFSNGFFGNTGNVDWFLKSDRAEDKKAHTDAKPVVSCSDAHSFQELDERLGKVFTNSDGATLEPTWIKADVTFEGLKQIIFEPENRVFIGEEPEIERRVRSNKTNYIDKLNISCVDGYREQHGIWFRDEEIVLGKELVAIIGNKGSGKSAVTDVIGLLGNSHNQFAEKEGGRREELFSFLNKDKFHKRRCARNFHGELHWYEGEPDASLLDAETDLGLTEKVEYLPQKYLERVCSNIDDDDFRKTLNEVIFRYVEEKDRFDQDSLDDLIDYRTKQADEEIDDAKRSLRQANEEVVSIEKKLVPEYRDEIEEKIRLKQEAIDAHGGAQAEAKAKPKESTDESPNPEQAEIARLDAEIKEKGQKISELEDEQVATNKETEALSQARQAIEREASNLTSLKTQHGTALEGAGLSFEAIVQVTTNFRPLDEAIERRRNRLGEIARLLATADDIIINLSSIDESDRESAIETERTASLVCQKDAAEQQKQSLVEKMSKPEREYQAYLKDLNQWQERENELRGDEENPKSDSLLGIQLELSKFETLYPQQLLDARDKREKASKAVFRKKRELIGFYNDVKVSIDAELDKCREDLGAYDISIEAGLRLNRTFYEDFLRFMNQSKKGSFHGTEDGNVMLQRLCEPITEWEDETQVFPVLADIIDALHVDRRISGEEGEREQRNVFQQIAGQRSVAELYDFLFGFDYLQTKYDLKIDQKDLSELSPGERGGLLLIFYLMLDRQDIPLVIDQPEDNLDNRSVYEILATFIKIAKVRRQIIMVTHNPNLAVVADAEQIIYVTIDKKDGKHEFDFASGSIEDPKINKTVVDILEGTLPAFDNRRLKYRRH